MANPGKKRYLRFSCPRCRHPITVVMQTSALEDGMMLRRRRCPACDHRWFTAQEPEFMVTATRVGYGHRGLVWRESDQ